MSKIIVGVESEEQFNEIVIASEGLLPKIPLELYTDDNNLLNPSNWKYL